MKILIVGAGAIGYVYGRHFSQGGAEVSFLVKKKSQAIAFFPLNPENRLQWPHRKHSLLAQRMSPSFWPSGREPEMLLSLDQVIQNSWDAILLCISSTSLRTREIDLLFQGVKGNCVWIGFQSGVQDADYLRNCIKKKNQSLVLGMVPFLSYWTPLLDECPDQVGLAYWFPPGAKGYFSGSQAHKWVAILRQGGFPAHLVNDVERAVSGPSAVLAVLVLGLRSVRWNWVDFLKTTAVEEVSMALGEVFCVLHKKYSHSFYVRCCYGLFQKTSRIVFKIGYFLSRCYCPMNLELYFKVHFTKLQIQMDQMMEDYLQLGKQYQIALPVTTALYRKVQDVRDA